MAILLQRLCWNVDSWRGPSGILYGKESSYVGKNGFGHEEWNFNTSDLIDSFIYGYTYYTPPQDSALSMQSHNILFFAINQERDRLLVGRYRDAIFLNAHEREELKRLFQKSDVFTRRIDELLALNLPSIDSDLKAENLLLTDFAMNVRVRPEDIEILNPPQELTADVVEGRDPRRLNRYTKPLFLSKEPQLSILSQARGGKAESGREDYLPVDSYLRYTKPHMKVILRAHNILSNRLKDWLETNGALNVRVECKSTDIVCQHDGFTYLFELKICYRQSTRHSLREALGQILEYAYYPNRKRCDYLTIVIDTDPSPDDLQWFHELKSSGLEVELLWLKGTTLFTAGILKTALFQKARSINVVS